MVQNGFPLVPYNPIEYEDTQYSNGETARELNMYLNVPTQVNFEKQRDLLEGK